MSAVITILKRILSVFRKDRYLDDLHDEMNFHMAMQADRYVESGMCRADAVKAAETDFGSSFRQSEQAWSEWAFIWLDELVHDIRYAIRLLLQNKAWTAVAVLSLALGIGGNTAIFSVFDALLLKSLPVRAPEELVAPRGQYHYPFFEALREEHIFLDVLASSGVSEQDVELEGGQPERIPLSLVSGSYFSMLGVRAAAGRLFTATDDRGGGEQAVAVLSHGYWTRRFARDAAVIGRSIRIKAAPVTIIGVAAPGFFGENVGKAPDLWLPLTAWPQVMAGRNLLQSRGTAWLDIIGRRRPDTGVAQAEARLTILFQRVLTDIFGPAAAADDRKAIMEARVRLMPADKGLSTLRDRFSTPLAIVFGIVALILLIACANVANLLLARASARTREVGVRLALGISRMRLIRQLLTENLVLSGVSTALGALIAFRGSSFLLRLASANGTPLPLNAGINGRALLFAVTLSMLAAIVFGFAPLVHSARLNVVDSLRRQRDSSPRFGLGSFLVAGQIAISVVLLMSAGLFLKTLSSLRAVDLGFRAGNLLIVDLNPLAAGYEGSRYAAFARQLLEKFKAVPGVEAATFSENGALMARDSGTNRMRPDNFLEGPEGIPHSDFDLVGPEYFSTMGISLLAGRDFSKSDDASAERVLVINQTMARRFFDGINPIGRQMLWQFGKSQTAWRIVGVAPDVKQNSLRNAAGLRFYIPYFQQPARELASLRLIARTAAGEEAVRGPLHDAAHAIDPRVPILGTTTVTALVDRTLAQERMVATLSGLFAGIGLVLSSIGLYGLMSYRIARTTTEIGIRVAIGATAGGVVRMVMRNAMTVVLTGILAGVAGALAVSRLAATLLFGITPNDPATLAATATVLILVGAVVSFLPARRAARTDPLLALRHE